MSQSLNRWLRILWLLGLLASIGVLIASLPGYFARPAAADPSGALTALSQVGVWLGVILSLSAALSSLALACLLFWKKANEPMALFLSFFLLAYGIVLSGPLEAFLEYWQPQAPYLGLQLQTLFFGVPAMVLVLVFPNGRFEPRWSRIVVPLAALVFFLMLAIDFEESLKLSTLRAQIVNLVGYGLFLFALGIQAYRYRRVYTPVERQQTKWVVYGTLLWIVLLGVSSIPYYYLLNLPPDTPRPWWASFAGASWWLGLNVIPVAFTLAIMRSRLWAIDVLIRRTVTYSILTGLLALTYFGGVVLLQSLFAVVGGQRSELAIVASTLAIAALFLPLRRRVQNAIDRRFYRKKYDAAKTLAEFGQTARDETDLEKLTARLVEVVQETMQPAHVSLWLKDFNATPAKARGQAAQRNKDAKEI